MSPALRAPTIDHRVDASMEITISRPTGESLAVVVC